MRLQHGDPSPEPRLKETYEMDGYEYVRVEEDLLVRSCTAQP